MYVSPFGVEHTDISKSHDKRNAALTLGAAGGAGAAYKIDQDYKQYKKDSKPIKRHGPLRWIKRDRKPRGIKASPAAKVGIAIDAGVKAAKAAR